MLHIATDNARDETRINLSCRAALCHRARPVDRAALLYPARRSFESGRYDFMKTLKCFPGWRVYGINRLTPVPIDYKVSSHFDRESLVRPEMCVKRVN